MNIDQLDYLGDLSPYYVLDIDVQHAVNRALDLDHLRQGLDGGPIGIWFYHNHELEQVYERSWLQYMRSIGLDVGTCIIFYRDAHYVHPSCHIDIHKKTESASHYAINFVLDPEDDSDMIWYSYPAGTTNLPPLSNTPADTPYVGWPLDGYTGKELCRHTIGPYMTLVNTSMPHNVETRSRPRWVISTRFQRDANNSAGESWQQAVKFFRPYFRTLA